MFYWSLQKRSPEVSIKSLMDELIGKMFEKYENLQYGIKIKNYTVALSIRRMYFQILSNPLFLSSVINQFSYSPLCRLILHLNIRREILLLNQIDFIDISACEKFIYRQQNNIFNPIISFIWLTTESSIEFSDIESIKILFK